MNEEETMIKYNTCSHCVIPPKLKLTDNSNYLRRENKFHAQLQSDLIANVQNKSGTFTSIPSLFLGFDSIAERRCVDKITFIEIPTWHLLYFSNLQNKMLLVC